MANYYRGDQPHLPRQELKHAGKKGMRWGISNNPAYKAVGNLAKGVLRNGRYFYDYVTGSSRRQAKSERDAALRGLKYGYSNKETSADTRNKLTKQYTEKNDRYNKSRSLGSDIENLVRGAKGKARLAGTAIKNRAGKAGKNVGNWLNDRRNNVAEAAGYITGSSRRQAKSERDAALRGLKYGYSNNKTSADTRNKLTKQYTEKNDRYNKSRSLKGDADQFIKNVLTNIGWKKQKKRK